MSIRRTCRVCGCHDRSACWGEDTGACWWVEPNLCSACSGDQPDASRDVPSDLVAAGYPGDEAIIGPVEDDWLNLAGSGPVPIEPREG
jgi:hypothetical protein